MKAIAIPTAFCLAHLSYQVLGWAIQKRSVAPWWALLGFFAVSLALWIAADAIIEWRERRIVREVLDRTVEKFRTIMDASYADTRKILTDLLTKAKRST